jgi:hypothetical protein
MSKPPRPLTPSRRRQPRPPSHPTPITPRRLYKTSQQPRRPQPAESPLSHFPRRAETSQAVHSSSDADSSATSISPASSVTSSTSLASFTSSTSSPPDFSRHSRRCCICLHPDRDAIEGDFIRWRSPELIARDYKIANRTSIYRHAHCTGLFAWRRRELGRVLEGILENAEHVPLEASDAIVCAARVYAHLDENGNWFEPPRTNVILTGPAPALYPLKSSMPTNSGRTKRRSKKRARIAVTSNSNIRLFRKKVK